MKGHYNIGNTLFPGDVAPYEITVTINIDEIIAKEKKDFGTSIGMFTPELIGCITYRPTFEEEFHQTPFILSLFKFDPKMPKARFAFIPSDGDIPIEHLVLTQLPFGVPPD